VFKTKIPSPGGGGIFFLLSPANLGRGHKTIAGMLEGKGGSVFKKGNKIR